MPNHGWGRWWLRCVAIPREGRRPCSRLQPGPQRPSHLLGKYKMGQCGLAFEQAQRPLFLFRGPSKEGKMFPVSRAIPSGAAPGLQLSPSQRRTSSGRHMPDSKDHTTIITFIIIFITISSSNSTAPKQSPQTAKPRGVKLGDGWEENKQLHSHIHASLCV